MDPVLGIVLLSALFVGSHLALSISHIRGWLVGRLGEAGFTVLYSLFAWASFGVALFYYDQHRHEGPAGLHAEWMLSPAIVVTVIGLMLIVSIVSPSGYVASPSAIFAGDVAEPRGIERITRHPQFAGIALYGLGHCLLSQTMVGVAYFGSFVVLGVGGGAAPGPQAPRPPWGAVRGLPAEDLPGPLPRHPARTTTAGAPRAAVALSGAGSLDRRGARNDARLGVRLRSARALHLVHRRADAVDRLELRPAPSQLDDRS